MTTRMESLRRCRCDAEEPIGRASPWCGAMATQEDGLCDECRNGCNEASVLSIDQMLSRDRVGESVDVDD